MVSGGQGGFVPGGEPAAGTARSPADRAGLCVRHRGASLPGDIAWETPRRNSPFVRHTARHRGIRRRTPGDPIGARTCGYSPRRRTLRFPSGKFIRSWGGRARSSQRRIHSLMGRTCAIFPAANSFAHGADLRDLPSGEFIRSWGGPARSSQRRIHSLMGRTCASFPAANSYARGADGTLPDQTPQRASFAHGEDLCDLSAADSSPLRPDGVLQRAFAGAAPPDRTASSISPVRRST
jgi:hypothetical protein